MSFCKMLKSKYAFFGNFLFGTLQIQTKYDWSVLLASVIMSYYVIHEHCRSWNYVKMLTASSKLILVKKSKQTIAKYDDFSQNCHFVKR